MKKQENENMDLLHCKNCDGYYDPSLPNCPHCGEETANNLMEGSEGNISVTQYGGGFGTAGSNLSRAALLIIVVLLMVAMVAVVVLGVKALSLMGSTPNPAPVSSVEEQDPADSSAPAGGSGAASSAPAAKPEEKEPEAVKAEAIALDLEDLTLEEDETYPLQAKVTPEQWEGELKWSSSDEDVAKVSQDGKVAYVGQGECTVTVSAGDAKASCVVRCQEPAQQEPEEDEPEEVPEGTEDKLVLTLYGKTWAENDFTLNHVGEGYSFSVSGGDGSYSWSSSDSSVASVDNNGNVTATGVGTATITCTSGSASVTAIIRVAAN